METINGDLAIDDRGKVTFVNDFDFSGVKRFYMVENHTSGFVRAWHGHKEESKYLFVVTGAILLAYVPINGNSMNVERMVVSADKPCIVHISAGYHGFKTLTDDTKVIFYSTSTLEESKGDDLRRLANYYGQDTWSIKER